MLPTGVQAAIYIPLAKYAMSSYDTHTHLPMMSMTAAYVHDKYSKNRPHQRLVTG